MKKYSKYFIIAFLFIFIVIFNLLFIPNNLDEIWNYGFSYAIRLGEVPYRDFNMVVTPLFGFIMAIPLFFHNSYLSYVIFYSIFMTVQFVLLYQMIGKKSYLLLLLSMIFFPILYPTYNSFFLFLLILIIYLEQKEFDYKDYMIGFLIACSILTKQTVGCFFILPSILFYRKKGFSIQNRAIGFLIPIGLFVVYLLLHQSIYSFIDLCVLGLFDFTGNSHGFNPSIIIFIIILEISIYLLQKHKEDMTVYYLIFSYLLYVPLFDFLHLYYVLFIFSVLLFIYTKPFKIQYELLFSTCFVMILFMMGYTRDVIHYEKNSLTHFEYRNISSYNVSYTNKIVQYIQENDSIIYHDDSYFYRIIANQKIGFLDLLNHGNHGYHGSNLIVQLIQENADKTFLVHKDCLERIQREETQLDSFGYFYIVNHAKKIGTIEDYDIYAFS